MAKPPIKIIAPENGDVLTEKELIALFALNGYGSKRARYWIREFVDLGWMIDNKDGTYRIWIHRTVIDKIFPKGAGCA